VILLVFAAQAYADPGHGMASLWHLLTEPDHLAMILLPVVVVGGLLLRRRCARKIRNPFRE
jgi:hypothetical protein